MSPVRGCTANCTFEPPVSTPMRRIHVKAASRISWYSRSVRVCAGATVIDSPVCTPIASMFSIEQMTTTLSAWSRITSSSYSFQPATERSMRISLIGLAVEPRSATRQHLVVVVRDAGAAATEDERRAERSPGNRPRRRCAALRRRCTRCPTAAPAGRLRSLRVLNRWRSSAVRIASTFAPIISTPNASSTPSSCSATARLRPV